MPVPDFSPGEVLTAAAMDSIGLWKIASTSVGTSTNFSVLNCFSDTYNQYLIQFENLKCNTGTSFVVFQFLLGTSPATTSYYDSRFDVSQSGTIIGGGQTNASQGNAASVIDATNVSGASIEIFNPASAVVTTYTGRGLDTRTGGAPYRAGGGFHNVNTAYDGIYFGIAGGANFATGTVTIYGYRK
jgi:hypothetical protein